MTALSEIEQELQATFPAHSYQEWKDAAEALLKGKPFEKVLVTPTYEGFELQPIFREEDRTLLPFAADLPGAGSYVRARTAGGVVGGRWKVSQEQICARASELNAALKQDLNGGVTEVHVVLDHASQKGIDADVAREGEVGGCGLSLTTLEDLEIALDGVDLNEVSLFVESGTSAVAVYQMLRAYASKRGIDLKQVHGNLGADPIGFWARNGGSPLKMEAAIKELAGPVRDLKASALGVIYVDGNVFHNAGSSAVQELGFSLAVANTYFKQLQELGLDVGVIASSMRLGLGIGSHYFLEIAKLRASRLLWSRMLRAWGVELDVLPLHLHARTSIWNKTQVDPYVNMLRVTSEAFSAVIGGCDSLHVGPFDEVVRQPDAFSRRIARNVHTILAEECDLTRVIDPAGGSYYVEWLTDQVAQQAWQWFQKVEAEGGIVAAMKSGMVQRSIADVAAKRLSNIETRRDVIVGTNQYANATEKPLDPRPVDYAALKAERAAVVAVSKGKASVGDDLAQAFLDGATLGEGVAGYREGRVEDAIEALPTRRASQAYEALRAASLAYRAQHGHAPRIFQANWGPSRSYRMRADWTSAFYQAGGFEVINDTDFESVDALTQAFRNSSAAIAVITSSDEAYAESAETLARAIKSVDASTYVILAGAPGESEQRWRDAGVDDFVNVRVNNYQMLERLMKRTGGIA